MLRLAAIAAAALVASAAIPADEVKSLPGWSGALPSKWFSGYLNIPGGKHFHYTYIQSTANPASDPVTFWFNGGPGCSSLEGLFAEHGQLQVAGAIPNTVPTNPPSLLLNPAAWTNVSNMVYIESPACVGFSYAEDASGCNSTDDTVAVDNWNALQAFFGGYPELLSNDMYITGESYAGIYVPMLAYAVVQNNQAGTGTKLNLRGVAVGNGVLGKEWLNPTLASFSYPRELQVYLPFFYGHALISSKTWAAVQQACPDPSTTTPSQSCKDIIRTAHEEVGCACVYDVYQPTDATNCNASTAASVHERLRAPYMSAPAAELALASGVPEEQLGIYGPTGCVLDGGNLGAYLNQADVVAALHAAPGLAGSWASCTTNSSFRYTKTQLDERKVIYPTLLQAGLRVLIFNGDADACIPWPDNDLWTRSMNFTVANDWHAWTLDNGQVAGYATTYAPPSGEFSFVTIKGAGHMVAEFQPAAGQKLFRNFIAGTQF